MLISSLCSYSLGDTESKAVPALPAEGWSVRSSGRICLQWLAPQAVHAQRNLPHHVPPRWWVALFYLFLFSGSISSDF